MCQCIDLEMNGDYVDCEIAASDAYGACIFDCDKTDSSCLTDCSRQYAEQIERCPCQSSCPNGCPCPEYQCTTTTTELVTTTPSSEAKSAVLVLSTNIKELMG